MSLEIYRIYRYMFYASLQLKDCLGTCVPHLGTAFGPLITNVTDLRLGTSIIEAAKDQGINPIPSSVLLLPSQEHFWPPISLLVKWRV